MSKRSRRSTPAGSSGATGSGQSTSGPPPKPAGSPSTSPTASSTAASGGSGGSGGTSAGASGSGASSASKGAASSGGSTAGRASAARATGSTSPTGTARAGRRARQRTYQRSFFDRYRSLIVGGGIVAGLLLFGAFVFLGSTGTAYACGSQVDPEAPASVAPSATPQLGQVIPDMGRSHITPGTKADYLYCPPASGPHYNIAGRGPIAPRFYAPDTGTEPQSWIHNLEHGGFVILYNCSQPGSCTQEELDELRALVSNFPASPICDIQGGVISPVIARFDSMKTKYAAVVWNRALLLDDLDVPQMLAFWEQWGERNNPERQCAAPTASPSVSFETSPSPGASGSPAASGQSSPAASGASPAASGASPAASAAPSGSPASS